MDLIQSLGVKIRVASRLEWRLYCVNNSTNQKEANTLGTLYDYYTQVHNY